jgi:U3 small nucleolar RNA-associated protein 3
MTLPQPKLTVDVGPEQRLKMLHDRYPEFEHLRRDLLELHPRASELKLLAEATLRARGKSVSTQKQPIAVLKWRAITAYLGSISMYFALLTSTSGETESDKITAMQPQQLHDHPVMESLLKCRETWNQVKDLPMDDIENHELSAIEEELELPDAAMAEADLVEAISGEVVRNNASNKRQQAQKQKSKAQQQAEKAQADEEARRAEKSRKLDKELAALSSLTSKNARKMAVTSISSRQLLPTFDEDSDIGEETKMTEEALDEKAKRKKSLKFYTSQIAQKANKRTAAGRDYGGDMDVPHRERLRDRQARLNAEAEKRGRKTQAADEELGGDSDEDDRRQAREVRDESDSDDLYEQVVSRNKKRKLDRQEAAEAYARAAAEGGHVIEREEIGPEGKRKITYVIEKNKGLTPHRKKDVRNPRVKKRKKFEEKKKKLKSIRAVYSGGEGKGGYGGELTGIKKGLIKSIKL